MDVTLSGRVAVVLDGDEIDIGSAKCRALLASLALSAGRPVSVAALVNDIWGDRPPRTAEKTLQTYVGQLRRSLGPEIVERVGAAYCLNLERDAIDLLRFGRLLDEGLVEDALRLWVGPPLGGHEAPGLLPTIVGLEERWFGAQTQALDVLIDDGELSSALGRLATLTVEHPLREEFWALFMVALYRSGRQAEALRAYSSARDTLLDELGLDPGPRLQELEARILAHDPTLADLRRGPNGPVEGGEVTAVPSNLASAMTSLIGRENELVTLRKDLSDHRLVTLTGVGGVGKTRLALELATAVKSHYAEGVWWSDLAAITEPNDVAKLVAASLGAGPSVQDIVTLLANRRALLVLDNCEHLLDGVYEFCEQVLGGCGSVTILLTSREGLGLDGEAIRAVRSLQPTDAVQLFVERAGDAGEHFESHREIAEIERVCKRLDNMPLAVELAASRTAVLSVAEIGARLDERFRLLRGSGRRGDRHETLRAAIDWSYDLLESHEKLAFGRLSVFPGTFSLSSAEAVIAGEGLASTEILDALSSLVTKSLLVVERTKGVTRYGFLETVRQYATDRLVGDGQLDDWQGAHAHYFGQRSQHLMSMLRGADDHLAADDFHADHADLRVAIRWALQTGDIDLAVATALAPADLIPGRVTLTDLAEIVGGDSRVETHERYVEVLAVRAFGHYGRGEWEVFVQQGQVVGDLVWNNTPSRAVEFTVVLSTAFAGHHEHAHSVTKRLVAEAREAADQSRLAYRLALAGAAQYVIGPDSDKDRCIDPDELLATAERDEATLLSPLARMSAALAIGRTDPKRAWQLAAAAVVDPNSGEMDAHTGLLHLALWCGRIGQVPETAALIHQKLDEYGPELTPGNWLRFSGTLALLFGAADRFDVAHHCLSAHPFGRRSRVADELLATLKHELETRVGRPIVEDPTLSAAEIYSTYRGQLAEIAAGF